MTDKATVPPTIGRIVHYTLNGYDVGAIDRLYPRVDDTGRWLRNAVAEGQVYPALVVRAFGGSAANLQVFLDGDATYWATSRVEGEGPARWSWPPRV